MQKMKSLNFVAITLFCSTFLSSPLHVLADGDSSIADELRAAKEELTNESYLLQYKYAAEEVIQYSIEHLATVDTTITGNNQKTKLRTKSTRSIHVKKPTAEGHMQFVHIIDDVDMWSEVAGREAVRYNSATDEVPPPEFQQVKKTIGIPLSTITMDAHGKIVSRSDNVVHPEFGLGGLSIPLPRQEIKVGYKWSQPLEIKVRLEDKRIKTIKTRQLYALEKVETGVATISVKTQILTPVNNPRVRSQLVQRISQGQLRFDLDAGRLISKQLDWDEAVVGFSGPESNMKYLARSTETLVDSDRTAKKSDTNGRRQK